MTCLSMEKESERELVSENWLIPTYFLKEIPVSSKRVNMFVKLMSQRMHEKHMRLQADTEFHLNL